MELAIYIREEDDMLDIYGADFAFPSNKVRFVANALKLDYTYHCLDLMKGETRSESFLKINPIGKIPVLCDGDFTLFESNAIIRYLAIKNDAALYPCGLEERVTVDAWLDFMSLHLGVAMTRVFYNRVLVPVLKRTPDEQSIRDGLRFLKRYLPILNTQLERAPYLGGQAANLADLSALATLDPAEVSGIDLSGYPALVSWRDTLKKQSFYTQCYRDYAEVAPSCS